MFRNKYLKTTNYVVQLILNIFLIFAFMSCETNQYDNQANFDLDQLRECLKKQEKCLIVLSVSTKNIPSSSFKTYTDPLGKFGYDYHIIGQDLDWEGWYTRGAAMKQAMSFLITNFSEDEIDNKIIVVSTDTGDVLVQRGPKYLLDKFNDKIADIKIRFPGQLDVDNLVIVGGEWWCGGNCEAKVSQWFDRLNIDKSERYFPYVQGGFIMGPPRSLYDYYNYTTKYMKEIDNDDQLAMGQFAIDHPSKIYIDYQQELVATTLNGGQYDAVTGLNYDRTMLYELTNEGIALSDELRKKIGSPNNIYPVFIHVPNNTRNQETKDFWDKLVAHLKNTAWK